MLGKGAQVGAGFLRALDATGYGEITRGAPVRIRKPDASETSEQIARLFQSQLSVRGFGIASTGMANVLSFRFTSDVSADPKAFPMVQIDDCRHNVSPSSTRPSTPPTYIATWDQVDCVRYMIAVLNRAMPSTSRASDGRRAARSRSGSPGGLRLGEPEGRVR